MPWAPQILPMTKLRIRKNVQIVLKCGFIHFMYVENSIIHKEVHRRP